MGRPEANVAAALPPMTSLFRAERWRPVHSGQRRRPRPAKLTARMRPRRGCSARIFCDHCTRSAVCVVRCTLRPTPATAAKSTLFLRTCLLGELYSVLIEVANPGTSGDAG
ncbi:hypothetical protein GUJ93_ZPchr0010g9208 [Zizania palustris]|uniref:Uncharacterized protein n=1 Tax=Zizania palustris TaxID=103762 RepID=A0A8J5W8A4_ZIZPA|nr:hypothetical protein GUJ93_ZPchr0010g9208 [Zizania palustris]